MLSSFSLCINHSSDVLNGRSHKSTRDNVVYSQLTQFVFAGVKVSSKVLIAGSLILGAAALCSHYSSYITTYWFLGKCFQKTWSGYGSGPERKSSACCRSDATHTQWVDVYQLSGRKRSFTQAGEHLEQTLVLLHLLSDSVEFMSVDFCGLFFKPECKNFLPQRSLKTHSNVNSA